MGEDRSAIGRVFGAIVPRAVDSIDPDALVDRIDVDALVERIDVDALITRVDVDGLIRRVDIDDLLTRIDVDGLLDRIDIGRLLDRIDVDGLIRRVDLNALLATVDVDALVAQIDIEALVARMDVNALVARLDLDLLLANVDVKALVDRAGIDQIVAEATTGMAARTLDLARRQIVGIDVILLGAVDRILRRPPVTLPPGRISATGRPAGPVSRILSFVADSFAVSLLFSLFVYFGRALVELFVGHAVRTTGAGPIWAGVFLAWWFTYLWAGLVIAGRTPGKALVGLRVVAADGHHPLTSGRAALRTLAFPFSFVLGLGFIPGVVRRDRRALHDLIAGSQELVDWGDRAANLPSALESWIDRSRATPTDADPVVDVVDVVGDVAGAGPTPID